MDIGDNMCNPSIDWIKCKGMYVYNLTNMHVRGLINFNFNDVASEPHCERAEKLNAETPDFAIIVLFFLLVSRWSGIWNSNN